MNKLEALVERKRFLENELGKANNISLISNAIKQELFLVDKFISDLFYESLLKF